jgi:hypothetical protein
MGFVHSMLSRLRRDWNSHQQRAAGTVQLGSRSYQQFIAWRMLTPARCPAGVSVFLSALERKTADRIDSSR